MPIDINHENAWQNGGYAVQWWIFAGMALVAFGWQARREAHGDVRPPDRGDRIDESDRRLAAAAPRSTAGARAPFPARPPPGDGRPPIGLGCGA